MQFDTISYYEWRNELAALVGYPPASFPNVTFDKGLISIIAESSKGRHHKVNWIMDSKRRALTASSSHPFAELITSSLCTKLFETAVSAKLAADFAEYQAKADAHPAQWFREQYGHWRKAFETAADGGCVEFH